MKKSIDTEAVVSRVLSEDILSLSQAQKELQAITGQRPDKATIIRWIRKGVGGNKLEGVRLGGRSIFTSAQAINRFIQQRTATL
jgi:hypothetical protein